MIMLLNYHCLTYIMLFELGNESDNAEKDWEREVADEGKKRQIEVLPYFFSSSLNEKKGLVVERLPRKL